MTDTAIRAPAHAIAPGRTREAGVAREGIAETGFSPSPSIRLVDAGAAMTIAHDVSAEADFIKHDKETRNADA